MGFGGSGLENIYFQKTGVSRAVSGENLNGAKGEAGKTASNLGPTRKGSNGILNIAPGEITTLAQIKGPGVIRHLFITLADVTETGCYVLRDLILRIFWDDEDTPSVESPLGDFFCCGFGRICKVNSLPMVTIPARSMHCYFPMPFLKSAHITIENRHPAVIPGYFFQVDYVLNTTLSPEISYFHACWRCETITYPQRTWTILNGVKGKGHYIGTYFAHTARKYDAEENMLLEFYPDEEQEDPIVRMTEASGMIEKKHIHSHYGCDMLVETGIYDWYLSEPVLFEKEISVIGCLDITEKEIPETSGGCESGEDICSVAYWYQTEPHRPFTQVDSVEKRRLV